MAGDLVDSFFSSQKMLNPFRVAQIKEIWEETAGKEIYESTKLLEIANRKLYINLLDKKMKEKFESQKNVIIQKINEGIGKRILTDIIIEKERDKGSNG